MHDDTEESDGEVKGNENVHTDAVKKQLNVSFSDDDLDNITEVIKKVLPKFKYIKQKNKEITSNKTQSLSKSDNTSQSKHSKPVTNTPKHQQDKITNPPYACDITSEDVLQEKSQPMSKKQNENKETQDSSSSSKPSSCKSGTKSKQNETKNPSDKSASFIS